MKTQVEFLFCKLSKDLQYVINKKISFAPYLIVIDFDYFEYDIEVSDDEENNYCTGEQTINIYIENINISSEDNGDNIDFKNDIDLNQIFEIILQESPELYIK